MGNNFLKIHLFVFLITSPSRNDHVINFQILYRDSNDIKLPLDIISCPNKKSELLFTIENKQSITEYLDEYTPRNKTKYMKKITEQIELRGEEEEELKVLKPPRKPRTKKNKLGDDVIIINEM